MIHRDRITVRRTTTDADGYPAGTTDYGPFRATLQPLTTEEKAAVNADTTVTRYRLYAPSLPVPDGLRPDDRIVRRGALYDVVGDPEVWEAVGRAHHVEVTVQRVTG